jgi:hypothetical protein
MNMLEMNMPVWHNGSMIVDWPRQFGLELDRLEARVGAGDEHAKLVLQKLTFELTVLSELQGAPERDTATIRRVAQSKQHQVWRISHSFTPGVAVRLICWFPPGEDRVVVALFSGDKANMGDVFYDSVGTRADAAIENWIREAGNGHD